MAKRLKHKSNSHEDTGSNLTLSSHHYRSRYSEDFPHTSLSLFVCSGCDALLDSKILSSDINNLIQAAQTQVTHAYHTSICGSILHSAPSNSSADIFSYLRHSNFDAFRRSLDIHHSDIIGMRNEQEQVES